MSSPSQNAAKFDPNEHPHNRYNPLKDEWVLVCPHRAKRPWKGQVESSSKPNNPQQQQSGSNESSNNPLCPGAIRPNGVRNPEYTGTFVFDNDFPALFDFQIDEHEKSSSKEEDSIESDLFRSKPAKGTCKVMCFHPQSSLSLATMSHSDIETVIHKWIDIYNELKPTHDWVQIFENKGAIMGCSNPHPHCQIWACGNFLPVEIEKENKAQAEFYRKHGGRVLLVEYLERELASDRRVICQNENWAVLVPYWAVWPFETMIIPKRHVIRIDELTAQEIASLARIMKQLLVKYDNLFECEFPYSMGFHFAPSGSFLKEDMKHWQLHLSYLPPLLRSATVKKFQVGFELLSQPQRDLTPEKAADCLKELSGSVHYTEKQ